MRLQCLDLLRYGHFTDAHIELPAGSSDFHILYGPNEAGKSTALSAIEDLLFGIPSPSPYTFLHDNSALRAGAVLEADGKALELRRRKGRKDTLLNGDDMPFAAGDQVLTPYLKGIDKAFFIRMFSLDHGRLRKGGQDILEARDEIGQTLFSAGAGLSSLRDILQSLDKEADEAWSPRRAGHRKYYQAADRLDHAEKQLREFTLSAGKWQEAKDACDEAAGAYQELEKTIEELFVEQRKLFRIRRVFRDVKQLTVLHHQILALGKVPSLPENASSSLEASERDLAAAAARIDALKEELQRERAHRDSLKPDEALLLRNEDIQHFHARRIEVQKGKTDLPRRKIELAVAEAELRKLALDLRWDADDVAEVIKRIPDRARTAATRSLLNSRGEKISSAAAAKTAFEDTERQIAEVEQELNENPAPPDISALSAVLTAARQDTDIAARIGATETALKETNAQIERHLCALNPRVADEDVLASIPTPPRDAVLRHRDAVFAADRKIDACRERSLAVEQDLQRHQKARERLARDEGAVEAGDIVEARTRRDTGWSLVRQRYIDGIAITAAEIQTFTGGGDDLAKTFEDAVIKADILADRRFEHAEAAAQITITTRHIAATQDQLASLRQEERVLLEGQQTLDSLWLAMWTEAPFKPLFPDAMLEWLDGRQEALDALNRRAGFQIQLQALRDEQSATTASILAELAAIAVDTEALKNQPLRVVIETAATWQKRHEATASHRSQHEETLRKARRESQRKHQKLETATNSQAEWQTQWTAAANALGLDSTVQPEAAATQLDDIDRMREIAREIDQLRNERIGRIEKDIQAFAQDLKPLVVAVASDLEPALPEDAMLELERRLEEAKRIRDERKSKDVAIAGLEIRIEELEASASEARDTIALLSEAASATNIEQLKLAIRNSDLRRELNEKLAAVSAALEQEGDGLTTDELIAECAAVDIDQIVAREEILQDELKSRRAQSLQAAQHRTETRKALDAFGGEAGAAEAAALRQTALTEMREAAEDYLRARVSAILLQWAIERYRRQKQAPLLKRASEIFAVLTGNSFTGLRLEFDEHDTPHLAGVRPDGKLVRVAGLSTGSADQLYLALRIASIEDYLGRASAVPFVADDLFINFDDERAAAGFRVLSALAKKTQVLFFTHHDHLVQIARSTLGNSVNLVPLLDRHLAKAA